MLVFEEGIRFNKRVDALWRTECLLVTNRKTPIKQKKQQSDQTYSVQTTAGFLSLCLLSSACKTGNVSVVIFFLLSVSTSAGRKKLSEIQPYERLRRPVFMLIILWSLLVIAEKRSLIYLTTLLIWPVLWPNKVQGFGQVRAVKIIKSIPSPH